MEVGWRAGRLDPISKRWQRLDPVVSGPVPGRRMAGYRTVDEGGSPCDSHAHLNVVITLVQSCSRRGDRSTYTTGSPGFRVRRTAERHRRAVVRQIEVHSA
jgi:hypothetical protein